MTANGDNLDAEMRKRIAERCEDLEKVFAMFMVGLENYVSAYYEFQTTPVTCIGLRLSKTILTEAVLLHFRDIDRYKDEHGFQYGARANLCKVGAFTTYWLSVKRPIYDTHDEPYAPVVNDDFAIFVGMTMAGLNPHDARVLLDGRVYGQIKSLLATHKATPDTLVPLFEALYGAFPNTNEA